MSARHSPSNRIQRYSRSRLERDFHGTRLGWLGDLGGRLPFEPGILDLCKQSFKAFESFGCTVEEARPDYSMERLWQTLLTIRHWLNAAEIRRVSMRIRQSARN